MSEPEWSNADIDQYYDEMSEDEEYDEIVSRFESDDPMTMAIIATMDD